MIMINDDYSHWIMIVIMIVMMMMMMIWYDDNVDNDDDDDDDADDDYVDYDYDYGYCMIIIMVIMVGRWNQTNIFTDSREINIFIYINFQKIKTHVYTKIMKNDTLKCCPNELTVFE